MHLLCGDDIALSDSLKKAIKNSDNVYLELEMDNMFEMMGAMQHMSMKGDTTLADALMMPTTIYVKPMLALLRARPGTIHGMAHITGGGLQENIIRVVPDGLGLVIDASSWKLPPVFEWLQREGKVPREEMWRTFNCGIGFSVILAPADVAGVQAALAQSGLSSWTIGEVVEAADDKRVRIA